MNSEAVIQFPGPARQAGYGSIDAIRAQVSRIVNSAGFIRAERMRRFLEFVVEEAIAGRSTQLCEYTIGVSVFKRGQTFEPGLDPIVRNDARRLRQKLLEYYQGGCYTSRDEIIVEIPKGGYAPVFKLAYRSRDVTSGDRYRLIASLVRVADGVEVWHADQELRVSGSCEEPGLSFQVRLQHQAKKAPAASPTSQPSNPIHRWNRSPAPVTR